jgi:1-deoxyxylulose-5-phosphate synthase
MEKTELGLTGLQVSPLCFGTGTNGWAGRSNQGDLGIDKLTHLLRFAHERGVTFWDTADEYGTHPHVAAALQGVDRETTTLTTKTVSTAPEDVRRDVERYLRELGTDYIDILLFHCLTDAHWPEKRQEAMEVLSDFKEEGKIRAVGVSCHDFGAFETAAETDWVDVVLARINYAGQDMDDIPEKVVPVIGKMAAAGKGIYGMKVLGGGNKLTADPGKGIRFTCGLTGIHAIVVGMMSEEEILENVDLMAEMVST